ncbi:ABH_G0025420.mRNA.1.CDS.1 [Saccharomyces cerevisiae]|nr:ABH_G0025420.mRNA.1.CDS.1 [Saccharomyces cerevisiae]CAI6683109.1 ABH_G0025420.mRNA.1.CDS.1 [Saccharomyces cerevisiae]
MVRPEEFVANVELISEQVIKAYQIRSILSKPISHPYCHYTITRTFLMNLKLKGQIEETHEDDMVTIDGVQVHLSTFNKGLMEIANPSELGSIFSKQINNAKRDLLASLKRI